MIRSRRASRSEPAGIAAAAKGDSFDVVVIGAGIVGCATAWELARRGVNVCLLDRATEPAAGTTGVGEGNVLCSDKAPGPELQLAMAGLALYDEIHELLGLEAGIRRKGALVVHAEPGGWEAEPARVAGLQAAGVECGLIGPDDLRAVEPELAGPGWAPPGSRATFSAARARSPAGWPATPSATARGWSPGWWPSRSRWAAGA